MLPPEEVAAIHKALTEAQGNRPRAAEELGLTVAELGAKVRESAELTTLWTGAEAKGLAVGETYDRERAKFDLVEPAVDLGLPEGVTAREVAIADGFLKQEAKLQKFDWEGLGVSDPKTVTLMKQFEQGVGRGVVRMLDAMCGGMGFCFAQVSARFAFACEQLTALEAKRGVNGQLPAEDMTQYAYWHAMFMNYAKEMKGFNKEATAAAHTRLLIADRARKMQTAGNKLRRPGWRRVESSDPNAKGAKVSANGGSHG